MEHTPTPLIDNVKLASVLAFIQNYPAVAKAKHTHFHPEGETKALQARLRKIVGQLNGIERMMEADRDCVEVLTQLVSARKALKSLSEKIIHSHLHHCIESATDEATAKRSLGELLTVLERYVE